MTIELDLLELTLAQLELDFGEGVDVDALSLEGQEPILYRLFLQPHLRFSLPQKFGFDLSLMTDPGGFLGVDHIDGARLRSRNLFESS